MTTQSGWLHILAGGWLHIQLLTESETHIKSHSNSRLTSKAEQHPSLAWLCHMGTQFAVIIHRVTSPADSSNYLTTTNTRDRRKPTSPTLQTLQEPQFLHFHCQIDTVIRPPGLPPPEVHHTQTPHQPQQLGLSEVRLQLLSRQGTV